VTSTRLVSLALLGLAALPLNASSPRFLAGDAVFPVSGDLPNVVLQPQAGARNLAFPTSLTNAGDARVFLTLRDGRIVIVQNGSVQATPFLDIRSLIGTQGEGGLLSVAFHPRFAENGFFFVNYTDPGVAHTIVARYKVSDGNPNAADPGSGRVLLRIDQPFTNHNGGQLAFGPDDRLYLGLGDGGGAFDPRATAQDPRNLLGKLIAADVDASQVRWKVVLTGLRNPWRFWFDPALGEVWIGDVGQDEVEEIDRVLLELDEPPKNLGWSAFEGTHRIEGHRLDRGGELIWPVATYSHDDGCSVTGGLVYGGTRLPAMMRRYVYGDYCSGTLWSLRGTAAGRAEDVRREAAKVPLLTHIGTDSDGELVFASGSGNLYRAAAPGGS
jgi:glucose/arabinose dehydrogenase